MTRRHDDVLILDFASREVLSVWIKGLDRPIGIPLVDWARISKGSLVVIPCKYISKINEKNPKLSGCLVKIANLAEIEI